MKDRIIYGPVQSKKQKFIVFNITKPIPRLSFKVFKFNFMQEMLEINKIVLGKCLYKNKCLLFQLHYCFKCPLPKMSGLILVTHRSLALGYCYSFFYTQSLDPCELSIHGKLSVKCTRFVKLCKLIQMTAVKFLLIFFSFSILLNNQK